MQNTKIINLFGSPGCGKSTTRAGLFNLMKLQGYNVEEVTEYAKDMVWEQRDNILKDQIYVFAKQHRRISRLLNLVDYVITDSPILLSCFYNNTSLPYYKDIEQLVVSVFNSYDNINIFINRKHDYQKIGRNQSEQQAEELANNIKGYMKDMNIPFIEVDSYPELPIKILSFLR